MTSQWNAAARRELTKIYNARLAIRLTAAAGTRPGLLTVVIRCRRLSHLPDDLVGAALTGDPYPGHTTRPAGRRRKGRPR